MIRLIKSIVWLCCILMATTNSFAQKTNSHAFSIKDCVDFAHKNNVQVKNALLNVQVQEQTNREVTAAALPTLSGTIGGTDYITIPTSLLPGQIFGQPAGTYIPVQFGTKFNSNAGVNLQQLLFDGQVFIGLKARATTIDFQNKNVEVTEELIKTNIYKVYYSLVASKTQISIFDANLDRLNKLLADAKVLYKNGFAEKLDIDKVSVQISNLETEKLKALNNISVGYIGLKTLIGMPVNDSLKLTDELTEDIIKKDISKDSAFTYDGRKEYQYLSLAKKLNEYNVRRYQLSYLPTLSLNGAYTKNAQRNEFNFFSSGDWFTTSYIGINLAIPIFNGFAKDARLKKSRIELAQTENQIVNLRNTIDQEIESAKLNFNAAILTLDYQKKNMQLAESVYNQTKKKFEFGTGSNTEISTAQTDLQTAQANYINALYIAIVSKVDFYKAIGKL
jgi:outer membrane protein